MSIWTAPFVSSVCLRSTLTSPFSSMDNHTFKVEDELTVEFRLDDEQQSEITKDVIVKDVRKYSVGCAFDRSGDLAFNGPLGFYIMS